MPINLGNNTTSNFYVGTTPSVSIYHGADKVWPVVTSYTSFYATGDFTTFNGVSSPRILKLNTDGTIDASFNVNDGLNSTGISTQIQSDGKILFGGTFTSYSGSTSNRIVRVNTDGTKDTTFNIGSGFNGGVYPIKLSNDGKIFVGGQFTSYNGSTSRGIIKLNTDGTIDTSFNVGGGLAVGVGNGYIIEIQSDGKILVGGEFNSYSGSVSTNLVRINADGTRDFTYNNPPMFGINSSCKLSNDKVMFGGEKIARLNSDGTMDGTFITGSSFNNTIYAIAEQTDGKVLVGGFFTSYSGSSANNIVRINTNGTIDSTFNIGTGFNSGIVSLQIQPDDKIIDAGYFTTYNGSATPYLIRLNSDGTKDTTFISSAGFNGSINAINFV
jgi:uncharacterized delta-60 repeat protein